MGHSVTSWQSALKPGAVAENENEMWERDVGTRTRCEDEIRERDARKSEIEICETNLGIDSVTNQQ